MTKTEPNERHEPAHNTQEPIARSRVIITSIIFIVTTRLGYVQGVYSLKTGSGTHKATRAQSQSY